MCIGKRSLVIVVLLLFIKTFSQTPSTIKGIVLDEHGEPLPYADVLYRNSKIGTITDIDGNFALHYLKRHKFLKVSFIGFKTVYINLKNKNLNNKLIIKLEEEGQELEEILLVSKPKVRLKKKENPAYQILRQIWKNKKKHRIEKLKHYNYKRHTSVECGLVDLDSTFIKNILGKIQYDSIINIIKNRNNGITKVSVPLNIDEVVERVYGRKSIKRIKIEAKRKTGIRTTGYVLDNIYKVFDRIDVYDNTISIFNNLFVSPLSTSGFASYDYLLQDSTMVGNKVKSYKIYFFPRKEQDLLFEGFFDVDVPAYALTNIQMKINKKINLNLLNNVYIDKRYESIGDTLYIESDNTYEATYSLLTKSSEEKGMYIKKQETYENYVFKEIKDTIDIPKIKSKKDNNAYWEKASMDDNKLTINYINKVINNKSVKNTVKLVDFFVQGYWDLFKGLQVGKHIHLITYNDLEGIRGQLGYRTFINVDDRFRHSGYVAYGFKDKKTKYGIDFRYLPLSNPRLTIVTKYLNDVEIQEPEILNEKDWVPYRSTIRLSKLLDFGKNNFLSKENRVSIGADIEPSESFHIGTSYIQEKRESLQEYSFNIQDDKGNLNPQLSYIDKKLSSYILYQPGRKIFGYGVTRKIAPNIFPSMMIRYTTSFEKELDYGHLEAWYEQPISLGVLGILYSSLRYSNVFGKQRPMITIHDDYLKENKIAPFLNAVQSYNINRNSFYSVALIQDFNGFIFNRIPLIKKLKLKSTLIASGSYGVIDENILNKVSVLNRQNMDSNISLKYGFEIANIGIGNVRFAKFIFLWETTSNKSFSSFTPPTFGYEIGFKISL